MMSSQSASSPLLGGDLKVERDGGMGAEGEGEDWLIGAVGALERRLILDRAAEEDEGDEEEEEEGLLLPE